MQNEATECVAATPDGEVARERLGFLLVTASRYAYKLALDALKPFGISPREFGVLEALLRIGSINQLTLAKRRHIDPATMVALMDRLEGEGYCSRTVDTGDRRNRLLQITDRGIELVRQAGAALDVAEEKQLTVLDEADKDIFWCLLEAISKHES